MSHAEVARLTAAYLDSGRTIARLPDGRATPLDVFLERHRPNLKRMTTERRIALLRAG